MKNEISRRINKLRELMISNNIDAYYIGTDDFHLSEYVGDYFKCREYMSGFTGSSGTLIVTNQEAHLWTDGRYFIQAAKQLSNTEIKLQKMGEKNVPTITEFLSTNLICGDRLGLDGRTISLEFGTALNNELSANGVSLVTNLDLVDQVWTARPELSKAPAYLIDEKYTGIHSTNKIANLRNELTKANVNGHILTTLDDIAWLLNIRGADIDFNPLILSYAYISQNEFILFADECKFNTEMSDYLKGLDITIMPYNHIYTFVDTLKKDMSILISPEFTNYEIGSKLMERLKVVLAVNPTTTAKAIKNSIEIASTKEVHLKDAVAMIRFIKWLKENVATGQITELSASKKLYEFRKEQGCFDESFAAIVGYNAHGAIVHYEATEETDVKLLDEGLVLVDTGGHYMGGTTDITRTIVLGPLSDTMKLHFTAVLSGMFALGNAVFPNTFAAAQLDVIARSPLWKLGLDYNHGTGHGVGHMLNVHEFPNNINCKNVGYSVPMEAGMINSNEPGLYIEGEYGIRHENEMLCVKSDVSPELLAFEYLTFVPFDLAGIDLSYISNETRESLNTYHQIVFEKISPLLNPDEVSWLKNATQKI
ncbi:MAG: aminopeptidase P family protein [Anaerovoracaceae bacterium]